MLTIKSIYEKYKQDVLLYLVSITHNPILSEDLVSETFLAAIKSLPKFQGNSDIKTWLFSIARHKWFEHLRKEKKSSMDNLSEFYIAQDCEPGKLLVKKELYKRIMELLDQEEPRTKSIVMMRIEGYSFYEIAQKHSVSEGSARVIDFRTKRKLKEQLIKEGFSYE